MSKYDMRSIFLKELNVPNKEVALLLSGGIDSNALLFALLELGKEVTAYSFTLDTHESTDFKLARHNANLMGVKFVGITLPTDINILKKDVMFLIKELKLTKKTDIECTWPMLYTFPMVMQKYIATGHGAGGHFCNSKKGMIHYRHTIEKMDYWRLYQFNNPNYAQRRTMQELADVLGQKMLYPFMAQEMVNMFLGTSWEEVNRPKEKQPIIDAYPDLFAKIKVRKHCNLQLGDSGIAKHFEKLLETDWNVNNRKSVKGIYNDVINGVIKG